jgi:hypothetical protein
MPHFTFHVTGLDLKSAHRTLDAAGIPAVIVGPTTIVRTDPILGEWLSVTIDAAYATTARARIRDLLPGYKVKIVPRDA